MTVDVDGIPMSALVCAVPEPRAVILALHGGGSWSAYWDCPHHPWLSFLRAGAAQGFTVIALDRPGYGSSAGHLRQMSSPQRRAGLAVAAVDRLLEAHGTGAGVFIVGHSTGCELALRMAVDGRSEGLLGIELSATGRQYHPLAQELFASLRRGASEEGLGWVKTLLWEPARLYPAELLGGGPIVSPTPAYEGDAIADWASRDFCDLAARVRTPVHFTLGEYERVWQSGPPALSDVAALFTASPRVVVHEQADAGHNLSVGLTATAYHLKILSFVEECAVQRHGHD